MVCLTLYCLCVQVFVRAYVCVCVCVWQSTTRPSWKDTVGYATLLFSEEISTRNF